MGRNRRMGLRRFLLALAVLAAFAGYYYLPDSIKNGDGMLSGETAGSVADAASVLEVHFLDVGQGDAILVLCDGEAMLIDAGDNDCGTKVQNYLQSQNVTELRYAIGTHPDADHIGGLDVIITKFDCGTILMPKQEKTTRTYEDVIRAIEYRNYRITYPVVGTVYELGGASFEILAPQQETYEDANNASIAILLTHGENRFLFAGDAEKESETEMIASGADLSADVYKVSHHGSRTSTSAAFLQMVNPTYAVISCGEGNSYGHPHAAVLNRLRQNGVRVFRTDEQGTIVVTSDLEELNWNCSPSESWQVGEPN